MDVIHIPVLVEEAIGNLITSQTRLFVDATLGGAGHAAVVLERFKAVNLIGMDIDDAALKVAEERLKPYKDRVRLIRGNFRDMKEILQGIGIFSVDAILFDLGLSMYQLKGNRGFSFNDECPLDMRMDDREGITAADVVNGYSYERLVQVIEEYGEEAKAKRIARHIMERRKRGPITSAKELSSIILKAKGRRGRIHPATKTFQAIRIEVNQELKNLEMGIMDGIEMLSIGGRLGVISFHSLEDRMVKNIFKARPDLIVLTKRPVRAEKAEVKRNPGARSAKLRVVEKVQGG